MSHIFRALLVIFVLLGTVGISFSATIEDQLAETEQALKALKANRGALLSPRNYAEASENFLRAQEDYKRGKGINVVQDRLQRANDAISAANTVVETAFQAFETTLAAREDCEAAEAKQYSPDLFNKANQKFGAAVGHIEAGKLDAARKKAREAEDLYRDAELESIKKNTIGKARAKIKEAEGLKAKKYAPKTMDRAVINADQAEQILISDRYAIDKANEKAQEAQYEARHAQYITRRAKSLESVKEGYEMLFHEIEDFMDKIAAELNYAAAYDEGMKNPSLEMAETIKHMIESNQAENRRLNETIEAKNSEIESLNTQVEELLATQTELNNELAKLKGEFDEAKEEQRLAEEKRRKEEEAIKKLEAKVQAVYDMFDDREAVVLSKDDDLILRLSGLKFHSGKATIQPETFSILGKVMSVIQEFPGKNVEIEGHTDSYGRDAANQALSEERAEAVHKYFVASGISANILKAIGYGETRPVASNETADGRSQNRRIEIVIKGARTL